MTAPARPTGTAGPLAHLQLPAWASSFTFDGPTNELGPGELGALELRATVDVTPPDGSLTVTVDQIVRIAVTSTSVTITAAAPAATVALADAYITGETDVSTPAALRAMADEALAAAEVLAIAVSRPITAAVPAAETQP